MIRIRDNNDPLHKLVDNHPNGILVEYADVQFDFNYQAYIYQRALIHNSHITFPDYRRFQDPPFFVKVMITAQKFFLLSMSTYLYRWGHQNIQWNARKINDLVKGHIDNLKISKEHNLKILHASTCQRLEGRYKDLLIEQFNRNNIALFSLILYASFVIDFNIIEEVTGKKRKVSELNLLDDFRKKIIILLNEKCAFFSEKDDLLDIFQAICVDDGSPDNSIEILSNYAEKYGNIKVVQQKNGGLSSARNTGIKYASGEYLHFLDSDDTVKINTYEELYKKAKENNLDMLFFDAETIYETDEIAKKYPWYKTGYKSKSCDDGIESGRDFYIDKVISGTFRASACLYLLKTNLIKKEQLTFKEGIVHEDNLFTNCCVMLADRVSHINQPFLNRLVRDGSISIGKTEFRHAYGYFAAFLGLYHFVNQRVQDNALKNVVYLKMKELIKSTEYSYEKIEDSHQKNYYLALPAEESTLFYSLIVAPYILKIDKAIKEKGLEKAIDKAVNNKISVDTILQEQQKNKKHGMYLHLLERCYHIYPKRLKN